METVPPASIHIFAPLLSHAAQSIPLPQSLNLHFSPLPPPPLLFALLTPAPPPPPFCCPETSYRALPVLFRLNPTCAKCTSAATLSKPTAQRRRELQTSRAAPPDPYRASARSSPTFLSLLRCVFSPADRSFAFASQRALRRSRPRD
jgi:hypothetical protein